MITVSKVTFCAETFIEVRSGSKVLLYRNNLDFEPSLPVVALDIGYTAYFCIDTPCSPSKLIMEIYRCEKCEFVADINFMFIGD